MLHHLKSTAYFPASGATLSGDFQPQTGITAVVGENGAGKTFLTIEACRWLLFGKAALRGAAPDYKEASVTGTVSIRGSRYEISRGRQEWVKDGSGEIVAKGAEQVTGYITSTLGYGLDVFDLCNAATQGNVQKLGDMRPAERKAIIDKVLRLTDAEKAEKDCREEAKGYKREAEALAKTLRAPGDAPQPPAGYIPSASLRGALTAMRKTRDDHAALRGQLRLVEAPERPQVDEFSEEAIAELERYVDEQRDLHRQHRDLTVAAGAHDWSAEQLDAAEQRRRVAKVLDARGPKPTMTIGEIKAMQDTWARIAVLRDLERQETTCPKCGHEFLTGQDVPEAPAVGLAQLGREEEAHRQWLNPLELPDGLDLTEAQILNGRRAVEARVKLAALAPLGPDKQGELNRMRQDKATLEAFLAAQLRYERIQQANAEVQAQIDALDPEPPQEMIDAQADGLHRAELYEAECRAFDAADAAYRETQAKITEAQFLADEYRKGAEGIADARATVKALIAPKISRIATVLIRDMSMGKLDNLVVDDEMEITVGGQRIETLSGAGKTVANLALRIAMGQALVGRVFPVFLADEIDGDLSVKRREATLQALVSLKKHLSQIILVTHRGADVADHVYPVSSS